MDRVRRSFRALFSITVLATGALSWSLTATAGPTSAAVFAVSAVVLVAAIVLEVRILAAVDRYHGESR